jgi:hypothetical protein
MSKSHTLLKYLRLIHLYIGVFISPALLFFAFTGALQTFSLHETTRGSNYKPPAWAVTLAQIHKKQTPIVPPRHTPPPQDGKPDRSPDRPATKTTDDKPTQDRAAKPDIPASDPLQSAPKSDAPAPRPHNALPLKIFFLLVSIGLFVSTLTGLYMSYKYIRNRTLVTTLLIAGIVIPVLMTIL